MENTETISIRLLARNSECLSSSDRFDREAADMYRDYKWKRDKLINIQDETPDRIIGKVSIWPRILRLKIISNGRKKDSTKGVLGGDALTYTTGL